MTALSIFFTPPAKYEDKRPRFTNLLDWESLAAMSGRQIGESLTTAAASSDLDDEKVTALFDGIMQNLTWEGHNKLAHVVESMPASVLSTLPKLLGRFAKLVGDLRANPYYNCRNNIEPALIKKLDVSIAKASPELVMSLFKGASIHTKEWLSSIIDSGIISAVPEAVSELLVYADHEQGFVDDDELTINYDGIGRCIRGNLVHRINDDTVRLAPQLVDMLFEKISASREIPDAQQVIEKRKVSNPLLAEKWRQFRTEHPVVSLFDGSGPSV